MSQIQRITEVHRDIMRGSNGGAYVLLRFIDNGLEGQIRIDTDTMSQAERIASILMSRTMLQVS